MRPNLKIGNTILSTPFIPALRAMFPGARLLVLGSETSGVVLEHLPIDGIHVLSRAFVLRPWRLAALVRRLRAEKIDVAIEAGMGSFSGSLFALLSGARCRVGCEGSASRLLNVRVPQMHAEHVRDRIPAFVRSLGGECEDALLELVKRLERGEQPIDVPNFLSWKDGVRRPGTREWIHNRVGEFPDFAALPMPDYELFDTQRITDQKQGWFGLMSSRGCPYRCTYCLNHRIVDRYKEELGRNVKGIGFFRFRSAEAMIEEIRWVLARYRDIGTFILDDDLFTQNVPHALAFCDLYEKSGIGVPFVVNSHVKQLDERVA
ncbi:MAG: hypothetical protein ACKOCT_21865, partial [Alphaproteobacteria bacterium]